MRRPLLLGAAWLGSAGAAVGLGFLAVSLVGTSASPATSPAAVTSSSASVTPGGPQAGAPPTGEYVTIGGTVYANCTAGAPVVAGVPAGGWWVDDSDDPGEVEFENGGQKVEVHVTCANGSPQFSDEGVRSADRHQEDASTSPSSGRDDRHGDDDRHGGDDRSGDDDSGTGSSSSGRGGGDDSGGDD